MNIANWVTNANGYVYTSESDTTRLRRREIYLLSTKRSRRVAVGGANWAILSCYFGQHSGLVIAKPRRKLADTNNGSVLIKATRSSSCS